MMAIKKGVVLEIDETEAVILTDRGEFSRIPVGRRKLSIGMEVTLPSQRRMFPAYGKSWMTLTAAVFAFLAILPWMSMRMGQFGEVVAYADMDINPSIQLGLDNDGEVAFADPYNDDGRRVLSEISVVGLDMDDAAAKITEQAVDDGFITKGRKSAIVIALTPVPGQQIDDNWEGQLKSAVNSTLTAEKQVAEVETFKASPELRLNAKKQGLSVGKYMLLLAAREKNLPLTVAYVKKNSIGDVISSKGVDPVALVKTAHTTKDWEKIAARYDAELNNPGTPIMTAAANPDASGSAADPDDNSEPVGAGAVVKDPTGPVVITGWRAGVKKKPADGAAATATTKPDGTATDKPADTADDNKPTQTSTGLTPADTPKPTDSTKPAETTKPAGTAGDTGSTTNPAANPATNPADTNPAAGTPDGTESTAGAVGAATVTAPEASADDATSKP